MDLGRHGHVVAAPVEMTVKESTPGKRNKMRRQLESENDELSIKAAEFFYLVRDDAALGIMARYIQQADLLQPRVSFIVTVLAEHRRDRDVDLLAKIAARPGIPEFLRTQIQEALRATQY